MLSHHRSFLRAVLALLGVLTLVVCLHRPELHAQDPPPLAPPPPPAPDPMAIAKDPVPPPPPPVPFGDPAASRDMVPAPPVPPPTDAGAPKDQTPPPLQPFPTSVPVPPAPEPAKMAPLAAPDKVMPAVPPLPVTDPIATPSAVVPASNNIPVPPSAPAAPPVPPVVPPAVTPIPQTVTPPPPAAPPVAPPAPVRLAPMPVPSAPAPVPAAPPAPRPPVGTMNPQDPPTPAVSLQVRVPATVAVGKELEYHLVVRNVSAARAHHVLVRFPMPKSATFVRTSEEPIKKEPDIVWDLRTMEPQAARDITLVIQPGAADVQIESCARVQFEHGQCVTTAVTRPKLVVTQTGPSVVSLNDAVSYRVEVRNTGEAPATGVALRCPMQEGLEAVGGKNPQMWDLGTLAPGQSVVREYQALARKIGSLCTTASATAAGGVTADGQCCVTVGEGKVQIEMKGPDRALVNRPATFQMTVSNPGTAPVAGVVLDNPLPAGATFLSASDGGRFNGSQVQWQFARLGVNERRTVQLVLNVPTAGEVMNRATASAERLAMVEATAKTDFEGITGLTADVSVKDNPVEVGSQTSYIVTVRNQGDAAASKVAVVATIPEQMTVVEARGQTKQHTDGLVVTFEPLETLAPRAEVRYEIVVHAQQPGDARFQVEITAAQLARSGPVRRQQSTTIFASNKPATTQLQTPVSSPTAVPLTPVAAPSAPPAVMPIPPAVNVPYPPH